MVPDELFMKRALALARRGAGRVSPNPLVGAVVVKNSRIVGEGYHLYEKLDHAELAALRAAGSRAKGATLYVNLEPCRHHGRTPPCVERIVQAGVREACVAIRDPNPLVSGRGIEYLRSHGLRVREGLGAPEARRLNEKFLYFVQTRKPFVHLKLALTLDGRIAASGGQSRWITGQESRAVVQRLRYEYDAILAGVNTVLQDDPSLAVHGRRTNSIVKVVLDSRLRTPARSRIFESGDPVVIVHSKGVSPERKAALAGRARLMEAPQDGGELSWGFLLHGLGELGITSLLVEGGGRVAASALRAGAVQKISFFYAPKILGGDAVAGVGDLGIERLDQALVLRDIRIRRLGSDLMLEAYLAESLS